MRLNSSIVRCALLVGVFMVAGSTHARDGASPTPAPRPQAPPLARVADVCTAFDVTMPHPVGNGNDALFVAVADLLDAYGDLGVPPEQLHIHVVLHGAAARMALTDAAYQRTTGRNSPHVDDIAMLLHAGASVEVCANSLEQLGFKPEDLLPTVMVVPDGIVRLVDLQYRGCAYLRF